MNPFATRAEPAPPPPEELEPLELTSADVAFEPTFDREQWAEAIERLGAAEKAYPGRRDWPALRGVTRNPRVLEILQR